eukprot:gene17905-23525_t
MVLAGFGSDDASIGSPYLPGETMYSFKKAESYYGSRPLFVFRRLLRLARITGVFNLKLGYDYFTKNVEKNQPLRAKEALTLVTQLGPTFIKLGQALSIRTDLIPEPYALELRQLQDAVPPFPSNIAMKILKDELRVKSLDEVFVSISDKPIASASIGQVYKAKLKNGKEVAVKVQRPKIINEIALDLYVLRLITPLQVKISNLIGKRKTSQGDIDVGLSLVDEWGRGFVAEIDYKLEAKNGKDFAIAMQEKGLNAVTSPAVVDELSGNRVLVTEWMDGTRLDKDASPDVPRLCSVAINAYLTMLLDTGVLHCDPHPGNLLRTTDGRLCILDWGMTLTVPKDLQYALIEFIAHINTENYDAIPNDFINLGFSPANRIDQLKSSGLSEGLAFTFRQLNKGGGPKKIQQRVKQEFLERYGSNLTDEELRLKAREEMISRMEKQLKDEGIDVNGVTSVMEEMSRRNRELFKLPPYVLYVSRAFSTLEGIGLSINEDYSILQECYPYLARRLFTDDSPRAKAALREMLLGGGNNSMISPNKLVEMTSGFSSYTSATVDADRDGKGSQAAQDALLDVVLSPSGNAVQDILIEGLARIVDAVVREGINTTKESVPVKTLQNLVKLQMETTNRIIPKQLKAALSPFLIPLYLPYQLSQTFDKLTEKSGEDEKSIETLKSIVTILTNNENDTLNTSQSYQKLLSDLNKQLTQNDSSLRKVLQDPKFRSKLPVLLNISRKLGAAILTRAADRIDSTIAVVKNEHSQSKVTNLVNDPLSNDVIIENVGNLATRTAKSIANLLL